jgi:hypothetical protein
VVVVELSMRTRRVIVISGSMGAGKTAVMGEASDLLEAAGIRHAAIDLDAAGVHLLPESESRRVDARNLASFCDNCAAAGIDSFLIAVAVEDQRALRDLRDVIGAAEIRICRLTAGTATMAARLRQREPGMRQEEFVARSRALHDILSAAALEDFAVANDGRHITDVARELLTRARWI